MEGLISIQAQTIIFQILNTTILFLFLRKFLFEKVRNFSQKRSAEIASSIEQAEQKKCRSGCDASRV